MNEKLTSDQQLASITEGLQGMIDPDQAEILKREIQKAQAKGVPADVIAANIFDLLAGKDETE